MPNADNQLHVFKTFLGIPPSTNDPPVCGKKITSAYNGKGKPKCPQCLLILNAAQLDIHGGEQ